MNTEGNGRKNGKHNKMNHYYYLGSEAKVLNVSVLWLQDILIYMNTQLSTRDVSSLRGLFLQRKRTVLQYSRYRQKKNEALIFQRWQEYVSTQAEKLGGYRKQCNFLEDIVSEYVISECRLKRIGDECVKEGIILQKQRC